MKDIGGLRDACPAGLLTLEADLLAYSYDGALERARPDAVVIVRSADEVREVVRWCVSRGVPYVARGAGTNLSGGCIPLRGGVVISLAKMDRILAIDTERRLAIVEPGVVNLRLQDRLAEVGCFYAPDPASYKVCTLGGNVAENAGGPRCVKYGTTTNHIRAVEAVMPDGSLERFSVSDDGPEFLSLLIGAEGTLGVVTRIWCEFLPLPETISTALAAFPSLDAAMSAVAEIIAAGITPRVLEAMDRMSVDAIEDFMHCGYPRCEAVLLIEVEGANNKVGADLDRVRAVCAEFGSTEFRVATETAERERLWEGRRSAYAALARLAPNVQVDDGVVPRSRLAEAAENIRRIAGDIGIKPALLFHAGDGNLHPNIVFDERDKELTARVRRGSQEMLKACVDLGGSISGEHGIGVDKRAAMAWLFSRETLNLFRRIKRAMDPDNLANPDKLFPLPEDPQHASRPAPPLGAAAQALVERVREKVSRGEEIVLIGKGTKAPRTLKAPGREILTSRPLAKVLELNRRDYTARVEAGITPAELHAAAQKEGLFSPVPLVEGTLGGLLATKAWPRLRDHLLGMRLLLADGTVCETGAPVVKSVAGYDVPRLMLGSWGTLGIILEVTLKLYPRPVGAPTSLSVPRRPGFGRWHRVLREALDPKGLINGWVLESDSD